MEMDLQKGPACLRADDAAAFLTAFANSKRIQIVCELLRGELPVGTIAARVGLSQSALSQHLARLRALGLVRTRRDKQTIYYSCDSENVRRLFSTLDVMFMDGTHAKVAMPVAQAT